ncbi:MAG TPA: PQQ-binding-like beta-propeller repeat protein [Croceibacterium sp.]
MSIEPLAVLPLAGETWSTPAICEAGGRSVIVAADCEGALSAFDGRTFEPAWQRRLGGTISASPVIADLDGQPSILIGTHHGELFAIDPVDGGERWRFRARGMIRAPVAFADFAGERRIVLASYGPELVVLSARGEVRARWRRPKHVFQRQTKTGVVCAPLIYDVDDDGEPEIVSGGRSPWVICYDVHGRPKWYHRLRYDTDATPSFVRVGGIPMVLIGGGEHVAGRGDNALIALDGRTGDELWRVPVGGAIDCAPMIAQLPSGRTLAFCGTLASHKVAAVDLASGTLAWAHGFGPTALCDHGARDGDQPEGDNQCRRASGAPYFTAFARCRSYVNPLVADLDGDGRLEVATGSNNGTLTILDAELGAVRHEEDTHGMVRGSFAMADMDGDGRAELAVPSGDSLRIYRLPANPPPVRFYKGRGDMLGADHEAAASLGPVRPARPAVRAAMWRDLVARDAMRHARIQFDKFVLRRFGGSRFDYYY